MAKEGDGGEGGRLVKLPGRDAGARSYLMRRLDPVARSSLADTRFQFFTGKFFLLAAVMAATLVAAVMAATYPAYTVANLKKIRTMEMKGDGDSGGPPEKLMVWDFWDSDHADFKIRMGKFYLFLLAAVVAVTYLACTVANLKKNRTMEMKGDGESGGPPETDFKIRKPNFLLRVAVMAACLSYTVADLKNIRTMEMKGDGDSGGRLEKLLGRDAGTRRPLADTIFQLCMRAAIVLASCYAAFVAYLAMMYTETWLEKLRLLPLLIFSLTVSLLGAVMIRKKCQVELRS